MTFLRRLIQMSRPGINTVLGPSSIYILALRKKNKNKYSLTDRPTDRPA